MAAKRRRRPSGGTGYGRPPKHTQFRPGVSGNPKGRPKGSKSLRSELAKVLRERITRSDGRSITLGKLIAKQLGHQAGKGDLRSIGMLLKELGPDEADATAAHVERVSFDQPEDARVMQDLVARIRAAGAPPAGGAETPSKPEAPDAPQKPEAPSTEPKE